MTFVVAHPLVCVLAVSVFAVTLGLAAALLPERWDR